jgi:hypothetical protein
MPFITNSGLFSRLGDPLYAKHLHLKGMSYATEREANTIESTSCFHL